ncbi:MAG TPA: Spy/CpxP family protein refolding chaperone [Burkholderiaceae bacterium]|nr:Spy/CpxP family protein refolding chaperone [Burkholderiaceae bacterium]
MNLTTILRKPSLPTRLLTGAVLVAALGTATLSAWAQPGGHVGHGMRGGPGMGMMQGHMLERMLDSVNASADQRTQIKQIAERARADMRAQHESGRALRERAMQLFTQPVVDANAAEALRVQMLQQHDQASRRMMQAMLEVSRVLTPEQRKQFAERMAQRRSMMERHRSERQQLDGTKPAPR